MKAAVLAAVVVLGVGVPLVVFVVLLLIAAGPS